MGLKLKWFRRRITFDGVMPAPERTIRQKEATSGTVVGVYRQSKNFEDYIEPAKTSYWQPPPQAIARATYRLSNPTTTSTNSPSTSSSSMARGTIVASTSSTVKPTVPPAATPFTIPTTISSVSRPPTGTSAADVVIGSVDTSEDKIAHASNGVLRRHTPPEPTYTPPQPPVRKAKSVGSLANATSSARYPAEDGNSSDDSSSGYVTSYELRAPRSVEVLSAPSPPKTPTQDPEPPRVPPVAPSPRITTSATSLPLRNGPSSPTARKLVVEEPDYIVPLAEAEPIYDSFEGVFERVKLRKPASPSSSSQRSADPVTPSTGSPTPRQREPVLVVTSVPNPEMSPPQPKSILKKRAPPPPTLVEAMSALVDPTVSEPVMAIPTPPPRTTRGTPSAERSEATPEPPRAREPSPRAEKDVQMVPQVAYAVEHANSDDGSDSDDDFNWDFVQRHRSSINQTVAAQTQIDPEVLRNAPASLRQGPAAQSTTLRHPTVEPIAQPRTLRGMRNQRARPQEAASWNGAEPPERTSRARASDSNNSETSA